MTSDISAHAIMLHVAVEMCQPVVNREYAGSNFGELIEIFPRSNQIRTPIISQPDTQAIAVLPAKSPMFASVFLR